MVVDGITMKINYTHSPLQKTWLEEFRNMLLLELKISTIIIPVNRAKYRMYTNGYDCLYSCIIWEHHISNLVYWLGSCEMRTFRDGLLYTWNITYIRYIIRDRINRIKRRCAKGSKQNHAHKSFSLSLAILLIYLIQPSTINAVIKRCDILQSNYRYICWRVENLFEDGSAFFFTYCEIRF
jgi:hypothetical protein